jgi:hypothetical protein
MGAVLIDVGGQMDQQHNTTAVEERAFIMT